MKKYNLAVYLNTILMYNQFGLCFTRKVLLAELKMPV